ncbi:fibropellin-3-like [Pomacea canaliculata]|uniref:fibropellin-3-like n=1 Tax=Pomacea canaliculata TaxID=400727 RepID=UPI000D733E47|nr:fibropellin-3-like [Pomacea canaliculata]
MQAILLVTVFSCLLAAAAAAIGDVGEACKDDGTCTDPTSVCESNTCKIKAGATCTAGSTSCVSHSTCPATGASVTCGCDTGYTALTGVCTTSGAAGEACKADGSCADATVVCESSMCKIKAGQTCTSGSTNCVSQSTCVTGTLKCTCGTGYTAQTSGLCSGVAPQSVSSWLLTGSIITFLVTFSLP